MLLADFKQLVVDYMNRNGATFDLDETAKVDKVLVAINNARRYAQRLVKFEAARTYARVTVDKTTGGNLATAVLDFDGVSPVRIRSIEQAFAGDADGNYTPIDYVQQGPQLERLKNERSGGFTGNPSSTCVTSALLKDGDSVYLAPWPAVYGQTTTATIKLRILRWLPEYKEPFLKTTGRLQNNIEVTTTTLDLQGAGVEIGDWVLYENQITQVLSWNINNDGDVFIPTNLSIFHDGELSPIWFFKEYPHSTDFFLEECSDWLLYRVIQELNFFLKEDQRVALSAQIVRDAWNSMVAWNADHAGTETDLNLD